MILNYSIFYLYLLSSTLVIFRYRFFMLTKNLNCEFWILYPLYTATIEPNFPPFIIFANFPDIYLFLFYWPVQTYYDQHMVIFNALAMRDTFLLNTFSSGNIVHKYHQHGSSSYPVHFTFVGR